MSKKPSQKNHLTRRQFMQQGALAVAGLLLASCADEAPRAGATLEVAQQPLAPTAQPPTGLPPTAAAPTEQPPPTQQPPEAATQPTQPTTLPPTPQCVDDDDETPAQTEGPFYTPDTPQRASFLKDGAAGAPLILTGQVLSTSCQPLANAVLDFWHADDAGQYDNAGFRYRGHQFTDAAGRFRLETIMPGLYPGRTRHIHVKVQGPDTPLLTTQLYFPGEPGNVADAIFDEALLVSMPQTGDGQEATFTFVLQSA